MALSRVTIGGWREETGALSRVTINGWRQESQSASAPSITAITASNITPAA